MGPEGPGGGGAVVDDGTAASRNDRSCYWPLSPFCSCYLLAVRDTTDFEPPERACRDRQTDRPSNHVCPCCTQSIDFEPGYNEFTWLVNGRFSHDNDKSCVFSQRIERELCVFREG